MPFTITKEHRDFFLQNGFIEIEDVLTADQIQAANQALDDSMNKRSTLDERFVSKRDLWRQFPEIYRISGKKVLAEIACEFIHCKHLQLGLDQFFEIPTTPFSPNALITKESAIDARFSLSSTKAAWIILLKGTVPSEDIWPHQLGSALLVTPTTILPWHTLQLLKGSRFLVVVYADNTTVYRENKDDPHTYFLKSQDIQFGRSLSFRTHPRLV